MTDRSRRDAGMTLIEMVIVMSIIGAVIAVIAMTFVIVVRVAPDAEFRIDDARSTRGLQTWLVRDVASTPPQTYDSGSETGFVDASTTPLAAGVPLGHLCGASGTHILFMAWSDGAVSYRAQYTIEGNNSTGYWVERNLCGGDTGSNRVSGDVEDAQCAVDALSTLDVTEVIVDLCLVSTRVGSLAARSSTSKEITFSVASRNGDA